MIVEYTLDPAEVEEIRAGITRLDLSAGTPSQHGFYDRNWNMHNLLPVGLHGFLEHFRKNEPSAACLVHGFPVDDDAAGPTPAHWESAGDPQGTVEQDAFLAMTGSVFGDPFTWSTLQLGRMIQNVFPIRGDEQRQTGHGSEARLVFHTDDAFHPDTCDYLLLFGMRNPDRTPTLVASIRDVRLGEDDMRTLSEPRFHCVPDDEHTRQLRERLPDHPALKYALDMQERPQPMPVLFGTEQNLYIRYDDEFMSAAPGDAAAEKALRALEEEFTRVHQPVVIEQGTLLILDNYAAVHGRGAFKARYDGTDRWLRKLIVSRNLRKWTTPGIQPSRRVRF